MPGNPVGMPDQRVRSQTWHFSGRSFVTWGITILLGCFECWYLSAYFHGSSRFNLNGLILLGLSTVLAFIMERSLSHTPLSKAWCYRAAFLFSAGLPWLSGIWLLPKPWSLASVASLFALGLVSAFGALLGGLSATALQEGLWEDNAPPARAIREQVLQVHQVVIGGRFSEPASKRLFDLVLALGGLIFFAPVWLVSIFLIWFEDPGPLLFVKNSVKRGGKNFHQFKLRSMQHGAEQNTGPVLAQEEDERVLWIGRILRKTALDELPQLINILTGDMSFVGPRPQRTVLVHEYLQRMPEYTERHRVRPGLAGLAQVAGDYYLTPRQKLRFDRLYIRYIGLGFDLKLIALAFLLTFWYRWQKDWNGRLPRKLLHFGSPNAKEQIHFKT